MHFPPVIVSWSAVAPPLTTKSIQVLAWILDGSGRWDSNPRHSAWEADTLPTELRPHSAPAAQFSMTAAAGPHAAPGVHPQRKRAALTTPRSTPYTQRRRGGVAQLGERYNRTVEVGGSNPPASTRHMRLERPPDHWSGIVRASLRCLQFSSRRRAARRLRGQRRRSTTASTPASLCGLFTA